MPRFATRLLVTALLGVLLPALASAGTNYAPATHYRWTDASGVVHFSDTIPASVLAGGYDIVNDKGMVVRHVARELTPAERRAAAAATTRAAADRREALQRHLEDTQLLAAYPSDKDLAQSQQAQLQQIRTDIGTLETNLRSQEDSLTELLGHAADLEHANQPVPPGVQKRITEQRRIVNDERTTLVQHRADLARTQARFSAQLDRYRALREKFRNTDDSQP